MSDNTPDISAVISKLMQNEEFTGMVKELRGEVGDSVKTDDIMSKLPEIMSMLSPMLGTGQSGESAKKNSATLVERGNSPVKKDGTEDRKFDKSRATRLMTALKPYLSPQRCTLIDKCMSVMQIGDLMTVLSGLDAINKSGE